MKASLVSATSLVALLTFEAGPAAAGPLFDLSASSAQSSCNNVHSPSDCTLNFYALPGQSATTQTVTLKNVAKASIQTIHFDAAPSSFTGAAKERNIPLSNGGTLASNPYGFKGAATATSAGSTSPVTQTASVIANTAATKFQTSTLTFTGVTVAPIQSVTNGDAGNILVGQSGNAVVSVSNTGHGNLATGGVASSLSNLNGSISSVATQGFLGSGSTSISLADTSSNAFTYVYTPSIRGANSTTVTGTFTNGNASGTNASDTAVKTISGTGVAPVLGSVTGSDAGFVLVNNNSATTAVTVNNVGDGNKSGLGSLSNLNGTLGIASGMFSGGSHVVSVGDTNSATFNYVFTPTQIGASSTSVSASFSNGSQDNKNLANSTTATISGTGVAPIQSVSNTNAGYVLVGNSASATVTVTNTGNGNKDTSVPLSVSNLNGTIGSGDSVFTGGVSPLSTPGPESGLRDGNSQSASYVYTPTVRAGLESTSVVSTFSNGSTDGKNLGSTVTSVLTGQGVAPVQTSSIANNSASSVSGGNLGFVLVGQTAAATITAKNIGDGNLATGGANSVSNLNGSLSGPLSDPTITGSGGTLGGGTGLPDTTSSSASATTQTFTYTYAPTIRGGAGSNSATVTATFTNGSADGKNQSDSAAYTITGQGVAPKNGGVTGGDAGYVLVKTSSASMSVTVTNSGDGNLSGLGSISNLNGSLSNPAGDAQFTGGTHGVSQKDGVTQSYGYTFAPTIRGATSSSVTASFSNGSADDLNQANTSTATLAGTGVAPVNQVTSVSPVYARVGGASASSVLTVKNTGDGNMSGLGSVSNLNGSVGAISGTNWGGSGGALGGGSGLTDGTSQTFGYTYAPEATRGSSSSGAITIGFTNGSSDQTNNSQSVNVNLLGNTVGPVYQSKAVPSFTDNTPGKNGGPPSSLIDFGTLGSKSGKHTQLLQLLNITTDGPSGSSTLTDLSIESFTITGLDATNFSIKGAQSGTGTKGGIVADIIHKGGSEFVSIDFDAKGVAAGYSAILTLFTDEDADFGGSGNYYIYDLAALSVVLTPEPASMLLLSIGIGGVLVVRKRRKRTH